MFFYSGHIVFAQNQKIADSLKIILESNNAINLALKISLLDRLSLYSTSPEDMLHYSNKLLELASDNHVFMYEIKARLNLGIAYRLKGNLETSLKWLFDCAKLANKKNQHSEEAQAYLEIANTYTTNEQFQNALHYENKAIEILRKYGNDKQLATNLLNTGYIYYTINELDSALLMYNEAEPILKKINLDIGKAYLVGNKALVYWKKGNYSKAERDLLKAIDMLKPLGDEFGMADYHNQLARLYFEQDETDKAIEHTQKALTMSKAIDLKEQIRDACLLLSQLYTGKKKYREALNYQTQYIAYKDSIENTEKIKEIANMRTAFEVSLKEKEIDLLQKQQVLHRAYIIISIILLIVAVFVLLYFRQRFLNAKLIATSERKQHDEKIKGLLNAQETKALQSMVQGRDNERKRLAQELHNHFGSLLATIKVNLNGMDEKAIPNHSGVITLVDQACADVRNMSHALNMGISENFGLVPALKELTAHLQQAGGLKVEFAAAMCQGQMSSDNEIVIYRIVQELVSNVLKHAGATKLSILLTCFEEENLVNILVQDNGRGFNALDEQSDSKRDGMGISSLKQMVADRQGDIKIDSNPTSGTTVNIDLPIINESRQEYAL